MKFLEQLAQDLYQKYKGVKISIVFPTRRAGFFLQKIINQNYKDFSLKFYSMDSWISSFTSNDKILSNLELILLLLEIELKDSKKEEKEFYQFYNWAKTIIEDFNEIDKYLVNTKDFFKYLKSVEDIEEHFEGDKSIVDSHIKMIKNFEELYFKLEKELERIDKTYLGKLYKKIATEDSDNFAFGKVIFVGFNKLSKSESKIIKKLIDNDLAEIYFDYDNYYMNKTQEANYFIEENIKTFKLADINYVSEKLSLEKKIININEVATQVTEIKAASIAIENILSSGVNENDLAIILGDTSYLIPMLNSLPKIKNINIALGYPFKESILYNLLSSITKIQEDFYLTQKYYIDDIEKLFLNSYIRRFYLNSGLDIENLLKRLKKRKVASSFISEKDIEKLFEDKITNIFKELETENYSFYKIFFKPWKKTKDFSFTINEIIKNINKIDKTNIELELKLLKNFETKFENLTIFLKNKTAVLSARLLWKIFNDFFENEYIPLGDETEEFKNNTVEGVQILTLSSTQVLDFKHIIFLSVNEGILNITNDKSLIPFEIRKIFSLPTYKEYDSDLAYKFYRLIQHSQVIELYYYNNIKRKGERSRFIEQLEYEFLNINQNSEIKNKIINFSAQNSDIKEIRVEKRAELIDKLLTFNLSPTALNQYRRCTLSYYFKYAIGISDNEIEELDPRYIGTVAHETLEDLYNRKRDITSLTLDKLKEKIELNLSKHFRERIGKYDRGRNFLMFNIIKRSIENFLEKEKKYTPIKIVSLEESYQRVFNYKDYSINLKGSIDRVDKIKIKGQDILRIIDYKTGYPHLKISKVFKHDIHQIKDIETIPFQLLFYGYLYNIKNPHTLNVFAIMRTSKVYNELNIVGDSIIKEEHYQEFEQLLTNIFDELTDLSIPFSQTDDQNRCKFCDYKEICGRD